MALTDKLSAIGDAIRAKTGSSALIPLSDMPSAISGISTGIPTNEYSYSQENTAASGFINTVSYSESDYSVSGISSYVVSGTDNSKPAGKTVDLISDGVLKICDADGKHISREMIAASGNHTIYNIPPNSDCFFTLEKNGAIVQTGALSASGQLRMLNIGGLTNVRDLGGWSCDGGHVKYGKLIRGCAFSVNNEYMQASLTNEGKAALRDFLGVTFECDLREASETDGSGVSALGEDITYANHPIRYYNNGVNPAASDNVADDGVYITSMKNALEFVMNNIVKGGVGYIHCRYGRDRSATLAYILLALLGVSQEDIDKDYELTSLMGNSLTAYRNTSSGICWKKMYEYFNGNFTGASLRDKVASWAVNTLGISLSLISAYRRAMSSGSLSPLPLGYTEVEYIQNPSDAYCLLPVKGQTGVTVEGTIENTSSASEYYFLGSTNSSSQRFLFGRTTYVGTNTSASAALNSYISSRKFDFEWTVGDSTFSVKITYNGSTNTINAGASISPSGGFNNSTDIALFCRNNAGTIQKSAAGKIYSLTIKNSSNELLCKLIPCTDSSNVAGFYDTVSESFYSSASATAFVAGQAV